MKRILFIHNEKHVRVGAHYINDLVVQKLRKHGVRVDTVYPQESVELFSSVLSGISNILFFYSLVGKKGELHKYSMIQGTTYTTLPFLGNGVPVVSHFGSTTYGFLRSVPTKKRLVAEKAELQSIFSAINEQICRRRQRNTLKAIRDISAMEIHVAKRSDLVIATSQGVKKELVRNGVKPDNIAVVHNAIEDYWFTARLKRTVKPTAELVYVGRIGDDPFTVRLKGINRLVYVFRQAPHLQKTVIGMCSNINEYERLFSSIPNTTPMLSLEKRKIPRVLKKHYGDLYINPGRYEGFCLSLVEAMSQGLVPIMFPIGVAPEVIVDGKNGYLVHSVDEMNERIRYLQRRKAQRTRMAGEAVRTARRFKADRMVKDLLAAYKRIKREA